MADRLIPFYDRKTSSYVNILYHENSDGSFSQSLSQRFTTVQVEITRENNATPYGIGDVISGSAATPLVYELPNIMRTAGGSGYITTAMIEFNVKSVVPTLRLNFFNASNPTISGDNLPHKEVYADAAKRLGVIDFPAMTTAADVANSNISRTMAALGLGTPTIPVKAATGSRSLWFSLQTLLAVTLTASSKIMVTVTVDNY